MNGHSGKIYLLSDYRNRFHISVREHKDGSMDLEKLRTYFGRNGYELVIRHFEDIDFRKDDLSGQYVLYQTSEDRGLHYKGFIEDILYGLMLQGALLIPGFHFFRAHHNKVFLEILRDLSAHPSLKNIRSSRYGTLEQLLNEPCANDFPVVLKPAAGCGSNGVKLISGRKQLIGSSKSLSRTFYAVDALKDMARSFMRHGYKRSSNFRRKFIVQNYIPGLKNDFRVLVMNEKYYVLKRQNRKNDFRASGGGLVEWPRKAPDGLLDLAEDVRKGFNAPFLTMDIGCNGAEFFVFEFQFLHFGTGSLERSKWFFKKERGEWALNEGTSVLEEEFAASVVKYIEGLKCP